MQASEMTTDDLVLWASDYQTFHTGTGSGTAMREAIIALAKCGLTTAMCGSLDQTRADKFRALINNEEALNRVARMEWHHDPQPLNRRLIEGNTETLGGVAHTDEPAAPPTVQTL